MICVLYADISVTNCDTSWITEWKWPSRTWIFDVAFRTLLNSGLRWFRNFDSNYSQISSHTFGQLFIMSLNTILEESYAPIICLNCLKNWSPSRDWFCFHVTGKCGYFLTQTTTHSEATACPLCIFNLYLTIMKPKSCNIRLHTFHTLAIVILLSNQNYTNGVLSKYIGHNGEFASRKRYGNDVATYACNFRSYGSLIPKFLPSSWTTLRSLSCSWQM